MAYENIEITNPNFCLTPQVGTLGTINTDELTTIFRVKNTAGGFINDYTLSANILNEVVAVEYVGPLNLAAAIDDVTYFTLERLSSSKCIIKRWELDVSSSLLNLKQQIIKYTTGNYYYDVSGMGVEHYHRSFFNSNQGGINYLDINSSSRIETSFKLFLGPSTDADNVGATETVTVSYVSGDRVYLSGNTKYQYVAGDPITFYNNIYLVSTLGYGGVSTQGTIFKLNAYTGSLKEFTTSGEYTGVTGAKWSTSTESVAVINGNQLLFVRPYDSYLNWRSIFLNNIEDNNKNNFSVYDVVFDNFNFYKLMRKITRRADNGDRVTYSWDTYNHQQDTLLPYTNSVTIYTGEAVLIGSNITTTLHIQVRDQFGVGLRDVNVNLYRDGGDSGALFDPLNAQAVTDINGEASVDYISGDSFTGITDITVMVDKGSVYTGSEYVWNLIRLQSEVEILTGFGNGASFQYKQKNSDLFVWQIYDPYKNTHYTRIVPGGSSVLETTEPCIHAICYSYFTTPGGNWTLDPDTPFQPEYYPWFALPDSQTRDDGPLLGGAIYDWDPQEDPVDIFPSAFYYPRPNIIFSLSEFTQKQLPGISAVKALIIKQPKEFLDYYNERIGTEKTIGDGIPTHRKLQQLVAEHDLQFSQLKLSKHTHYVDGDPQTELFTNVSLDQFVFVEDAVPQFWSEKNPRETYIWIRLRPFAFDLDGTTLRFYVREVYTENDIHYDSRYYEVTSFGTITYFDAGGGILGVEFMYQPAQIFHHNAIVYIHLEIYDTAASPNYIYIDYWFKIIPDFNTPYLLNMSPDIEEDNVSVDTNIYFEIKDDGAGIDITTLEVFLNSRIIVPTDITKISDHYYQITIDMSRDLQFNKNYTVAVKVSDVSENRNRLRDSYYFYTAVSDAPWFIGFDPKLCKRGMPLFTDVSFMVLGAGQGVDEETIRLQVHGEDVIEKSNVLPIIYRIS